MFMSDSMPTDGPSSRISKSGEPGGRPCSVPDPHKPVWCGALTWKSFEPGSNVKRDVTMQVEAFSSFREEEIQLEHWPPVFSILPSKERAFPVYAVHGWLKRNKAIPLIFSPICGTNVRTNLETCHMLIRLLVENNIYALTSWTPRHDSPEAKNHMFFYQLNSNTLAGVFFPASGGIPELPPSLSPPLPIPTPEIAALFAKMSPGQQAALLRMPKEQRVALMETVIQRHLEFSQALVDDIPSTTPSPVLTEFDIRPDMWCMPDYPRNMITESSPQRSSYPFPNPTGPSRWPPGMLPPVSRLLDLLNTPPPEPAPQGTNGRGVSLLALQDIAGGPMPVNEADQDGCILA